MHIISVRLLVKAATKASRRIGPAVDSWSAIGCPFLVGVDRREKFHYCRNTEKKQAVAALAALAQEHRLAVFRLLVKEGPNGASAGEIADRFDIPLSTLSHHLAHLERAGLLRSWRVQRNIFYAVDVEGTRRLIAFLTEDCCQGHLHLCGYGKGWGCDDLDQTQPDQP